MAKLSRDPRIVVAGNGTSLLLSTARNVVLARLLGPHEFGIAATLLLLILIADMISEVGADRFLIQSPDGNREEVQKTIQLVTMLRGMVQGLAMIMAAFPLAWLFNTEGAAFGYMALALYPVLNGFTHLDIKRFQRDGRYGPDTMMTLSGDLFSLGVATFCAWWLGDYRAALIGLIARAFVMMAVSHLFAERRFGIANDRDVMRRVFGFGWPLFFTAIANFFGLQGDRGMVTTLLGPRQLGIYSAAAMLLTAPVSVLTTSFTRIGLARLARLQHDKVAFDREYFNFTAVIFGCSAIGVAGFAAFGDLAGHLLFGAAYESAPMLYAALGGVQSLRLLRIWPTCASFALGRTHDLMVASFVRLLSFPIALGLFLISHDIIALVFGLLIGETLSVGAALLRYNRLREHRRLHDFSILAAFVLVLAMGCVSGRFGDGSLLAAIAKFAALLVWIGAVTAMLRPSLLRAMLRIAVHPSLIGVRGRGKA